MGENGPNDVGQTDDVVVRKAERGWVVGEENVSDLTSAMVLADLFAADQAVSQDTGLLEAVDVDGAPRRPPAPPAPRRSGTGPLPSAGSRLTVRGAEVSALRRVGGAIRREYGRERDRGGRQT